MSKYIIKLNSKVITTKWWSQKWCNNIAQYADFYNRLERGRTYLRKGTVQDLVIEGGKITASVSGSGMFPYEVTIKIKPLEKEKVKEALKNLHNLNEFQNGRVSLDEKYLFSMDENGLFPTLDEIDFSCTCPDWASLCKHGAAVLYAIGSILDQEPLVLFQLRGIDVDAYLEKSLLEKTNTLLSNIYNTDDRTIDESMISDIFGIELGVLSNSPTANDDIDDTPKTTDIVRVIEIKPSTGATPIDKPKTIIRQYNLDGVFMNEFESYEEASNRTHIHSSQISEACNARREIAGEYQWRIASSTDAKININKYIPPIDYALLINCPIQQLDTSGNLIEEFVSAVEASRKTNISINWIRDALSGRQQQAGGFVWKLLDAIEERPSQEIVSAYQRQDIIRIRQENYQRQHQKVNAQDEEELLRKENEEKLRLERQKQEEEKQKELLRKQEEISKQRERDEAQRREETRKRQEKIDEQKASYRNQGLCQHCGGVFKKKFIFFTSDICSRCGKKKDY